MTKSVEDEQSPRCRLSATVTDLREVFPRRAGFCTCGNSDSYCYRPSRIRFIHLVVPMTWGTALISVRSTAISSSSASRSRALLWQRVYATSRALGLPQRISVAIAAATRFAAIRRSPPLRRSLARIATPNKRTLPNPATARRVDESRAALVFCDELPTLISSTPARSLPKLCCAYPIIGMLPPDHFRIWYSYCQGSRRTVAPRLAKVAVRATVRPTRCLFPLPTGRSSVPQCPKLDRSGSVLIRQPARIQPMKNRFSFWVPVARLWLWSAGLPI